jgi:hypothetical protein
VNGDHNFQKDAFQEQISLLKNQVESEVLNLRALYQEKEARMSTDCDQLVERLCIVYKQGLEDVQAHYNESREELQKELRYLKELSDSQQIMMKSKVEYIKELEAREAKNRPEGLI